MKINAIKGPPAVSAIALKNEKSAKAKRILIETDVHHRGYQAARKVDNGVIENRAPGRSIPTKDSMCGSDPDVPINK
jgi:hypothetical protein